MRIIICGDIVPTDVNEAHFIDGNKQALFGDVLDVLQSADAVIANLECPLTYSDKPIKKLGPNLKASPKCIKTIKEIGINHCVLSNNHIFDYGAKGLYDTLSVLDDNGIKWTGVGENEIDARKNMMIRMGDKKIAIINVCEHEYSFALPDRPGARAYDMYDTMEDIREAKNNADYVFVIYHGGKEYCEYPSPRLRKLCRAMANNGASLVICQHSHCIGCYEQYNDAHILYGQGNFHFVKNLDDPMWHYGLMVDVEINGKLRFDLIPVIVNDIGIEIADEDEKTKVLSELKNRSESLNNGEWLHHWHDYCEKNREHYAGKIVRSFAADASEEEKQSFAARLTCEAHTDVWRELFKTWNYTN